LIRRRYDVVLAHEEAVFICRFLKPIFRFKLVYDMHSSLPQQLTNFNYTESRLIHYIFNRLERSSINASDAVITICPELASRVSRIVQDPSKHHLIENSIHEIVKLKGDDENGESQQSSGDSTGLPAGRYCFVYAGTFEHYQGIDLLIRSFGKVVQRRPDAFLLIIGGTATQIDSYRCLVEKEGLEDHCRFTGTLPQRMAYSYMRSADVLLSPRTEGINTPLKIYHQLASGIPLVATNIRSHTQVLNDDVAFLADPEVEEFGAAMITAMSDHGAAKAKSENAMRLYEKEYSRESYVRKLSTLLNGLR